MPTLFRIFGKGILVVLPLTIVIWLLYFLFGIFDSIWNIVLSMVRWVVALIVHEAIDEAKIPSIFVSISIIVSIILLISYIGYKFEKNQNAIFIKLSEWIVAKIPFIGSVYYTIKDLVSMIGGNSKDKYLGVAFVTIGEGELMGFITKEEEEFFWVFCPLTPPTSGLLLRIHKDNIKKSSMSVSDGLKKVVSFGVK